MTKPPAPRTSDMLERFNSPMAHVLKTHGISSHEDMGQTLLRYVAL